MVRTSQEWLSTSKDSWLEWTIRECRIIYFPASRSLTHSHLLADHLCASRSQRGVRTSQDPRVTLIRARRPESLRERRPSRAGAELLLRAEERAVTTDTETHPWFLVTRVDPTERPLRPFFSRDVELLWCQLLLPLTLGESRLRFCKRPCLRGSSTCVGAAAVRSAPRSPPGAAQRGRPRRARRRPALTLSAAGRSPLSSSLTKLLLSSVNCR